MCTNFLVKKTHAAIYKGGWGVVGLLSSLFSLSQTIYKNDDTTMVVGYDGDGCCCIQHNHPCILSKEATTSCDQLCEK